MTLDEIHNLKVCLFKMNDVNAQTDISYALLASKLHNVLLATQTGDDLQRLLLRTKWDKHSPVITSLSGTLLMFSLLRAAWTTCADVSTGSSFDQSRSSESPRTVCHPLTLPDKASFNLPHQHSAESGYSPMKLSPVIFTSWCICP